MALVQITHRRNKTDAHAAPPPLSAKALHRSDGSDDSHGMEGD
jgi:hypothetical protein